MLSYILRRLLLIIPTLLGIMTINFFIVQAAPGGPIEQMLAKIEGNASSGIERITGTGAGELISTKKSSTTTYRGAQGVDQELVQELEKLYGFDKPMIVRYFTMLKSYITFDFGNSFYRDKSVLSLIVEKMPVSISLGLWSTLIMYIVSIPLGIKKSVRHGSKFDIWTSSIIILGNAIPVFLFAIILVILFAGGTYLDWFPLRSLISDNFNELSLFGKIKDYFWHLTLPIFAMAIGSFATLTMLTKNSFLDEINKQYVITARAKGLSEKSVLYKHVFRNAMLIIIAGFPAAFISMFFTGSLLIEVIFSLDGLGLLGFESTIIRDYPVMFGTLYIFTLLGLVLNLISDVMYMIIDPRIHFGSGEK